MAQQTPAARVAPAWTEWLSRWPTPGDLAAAPTDEVIRAWGRLGYPRRALRLRSAAQAIVADHGGTVPDTEPELLALPGVGSYTAAAVAAFAFGKRSLVLDVNIRRVLARYVSGEAEPTRHETAGERATAWSWVPPEPEAAALWSGAAMELGATVCTARAPRCDGCPLAASCRWLAAGRPPASPTGRRVQPWHGTDRQCRGRIMAALREANRPVPVADVAWTDVEQLERCVGSLVADGLAVRDRSLLSLPS